MKENWSEAVLLALFLLLVPGPVFAETPLTLRDCYQLALKQSERVTIQEQNIQVAEAKYAEALSAILPKFSFKGTELLQDTSSTGDSTSSVGSTFTRFSRPELKFNAKQPIFSGFREFHTLAAIRAQKRIEASGWENAKRGLFLDVAKAFYMVLQLKQDVAILKEIGATLQGRLKELETRTRLGKSRESEKLGTESELLIQQASQMEMEGALADAKEVLAFFTGVSSEDLADDVSLPNEIPEEQHFAALVGQRPDVQAAEASTQKSKSLLAAEKGAHLPAINVEANYYTYRVGFQRDIKWDSLFSLDFPLFQGGETRAKVQEAKIQMKQSGLESSEKKREALLEIKKAYQDFISSKKQVSAFELAKEKTEQNYRAVEQDYRLGLVNNLEVLATLKNLQEMKRSYNRIVEEAKVNYLALKVACGEAIP